VNVGFCLIAAIACWLPRGIVALNPLQWLRQLAVLGKTTELRARASYVYPSWLARDGWTQLEWYGSTPMHDSLSGSGGDETSRPVRR
jgi:hypothetical protein